MVDQLDYKNSHFLPSIAQPTGRLAAILKKNKGARIGQSAVISKHMHTFNPQTPEKVHVLQDVDAGQSFYQRTEAGRVCHIDVFHECGLVNHSLVAKNIKKALESYNLHYSINTMVFRNPLRPAVEADFIDIQTGTGGGRITGSLTYGNKLSLKRAHENHIHIAAMIDDEHLACLFYIISAVEEAVTDSDLELRCNEQIVHIKGGNDSKSDISPYTDRSDSFLQEKKAKSSSPAVKSQQFLQDSVVLTDSFDTIQDVKEMLTKVSNKSNKKELAKNFDVNGNIDQMLNSLSGMDIIKADGSKYRLTEYGQEFKNYLDVSMPEVQARLRQMFNSLKPVTRQQGRNKDTQKSAKGSVGERVLQQFLEKERCGDLALSETIIAAAKRKIEDSEPALRITESDLKLYIKKKQAKSEVLLLIDTSASMKGQRILAAKFLVRHLLLSTPDQIGVITFQDSQACVQVPFTRDYQEVESTLRRIKVGGATPLALGFKTCLNYLKEVRTHNPLVILLSDGVPTVAECSRDPIADALIYAKEIKTSGYGFMCIGLKPHRNYLTLLAEAAGGRTYLLDELEKQVLVKAAWIERGERCL